MLNSSWILYSLILLPDEPECRALEDGGDDDDEDEEEDDGLDGEDIAEAG